MTPFSSSLPLLSPGPPHVALVNVPRCRTSTGCRPPPRRASGPVPAFGTTSATSARSKARARGGGEPEWSTAARMTVFAHGGFMLERTHHAAVTAARKEAAAVLNLTCHPSFSLPVHTCLDAPPSPLLPRRAAGRRRGRVPVRRGPLPRVRLAHRGGAGHPRRGPPCERGTTALRRGTQRPRREPLPRSKPRPPRPSRR